jgi:hypothetical protein
MRLTMRAWIVAFLIGIGPVGPAVAKEPCMANGMTAAPDIAIPGTPYHVSICYLPEPRDHYFRDKIELREGETVVAEVTARPSVDGRASDLTLEAREGRFAVLSYQSGEFCNGLIIFDLQKRRAAQHVVCVSDHYDCQVATLNERLCRAELVCKDNGGDAPKKKLQPDIRKSLRLCP